MITLHTYIVKVVKGETQWWSTILQWKCIRGNKEYVWLAYDITWVFENGLLLFPFLLQVIFVYQDG